MHFNQIYKMQAFLHSNRIRIYPHTINLIQKENDNRVRLSFYYVKV